MKWYKTLTIHQKINMKELFVDLCGIPWASLSCMFTVKERIEIFHSKLVLEGFCDTL